jgi:hypothetical protein
MQQGGDKQEYDNKSRITCSETTNIHTGHPWTLANGYSIDNGILYAFYTHQMALKFFPQGGRINSLPLLVVVVKYIHPSLSFAIPSISLKIMQIDSVGL